MTDYWYIRFPYAVEWAFLCLKLKEMVKDAVPETDFSIALHASTGDYIYLYNKQKYSADMISKLFGLSVGQIMENPIIWLKPPKQSKGLPVPTVHYWGEA